MSATPQLSVVIPTYNRAGLLARSLDALERQDVDPAAFEVVVVDDGSADGTPDLLAARAATAPFRLRAIRQQNARVAAARNRGIAEAAAPVCLFIDDDIVASPALVREHLRAQAVEPCVAIGRLRTRPILDDPLAHRVAGWLNGHYAVLDQGRQPGFADSFSGNLSVPTATLRAIGGFAVDLPRYEDVEIGIRCAQAGLPFRYVPLGEASQEFDKGFADVLEDSYRLGVGAAATIRRHPLALEGTDLAGFHRMGGRRERAVRTLLALPPLPERLLRAGHRLARLAGKDEPFDHVIERAAYWRGIRDGLADRRAWLRLTRRARYL